MSNTPPQPTQPSHAEPADFELAGVERWTQGLSAEDAARVGVGAVRIAGLLRGPLDSLSTTPEPLDTATNPTAESPVVTGPTIAETTTTTPADTELPDGQQQPSTEQTAEQRAETERHQQEASQLVTMVASLVFNGPDRKHSPAFFSGRYIHRIMNENGIHASEQDAWAIVQELARSGLIQDDFEQGGKRMKLTNISFENAPRSAFEQRFSPDNGPFAQQEYGRAVEAAKRSRDGKNPGGADPYSPQDPLQMLQKRSASDQFVQYYGTEFLKEQEAYFQSVQDAQMILFSIAQQIPTDGSTIQLGQLIDNASWAVGSNPEVALRAVQTLAAAGLIENPTGTVGFGGAKPTAFSNLDPHMIEDMRRGRATGSADLFVTAAPGSGEDKRYTSIHGKTVNKGIKRAGDVLLSTGITLKLDPETAGKVLAKAFDPSIQIEGLETPTKQASISAKRFRDCVTGMDRAQITRMAELARARSFGEETQTETLAEAA